MKLATFIGRNDAPAIGVVDTARGAVLDLAVAARAGGGQVDGRFADMLALIDAGETGWPKRAASPPRGRARPQSRSPVCVCWRRCCRGRCATAWCSRVTSRTGWRNGRSERA